jgi:hypothetical protein
MIESSNSRYIEYACRFNTLPIRFFAYIQSEMMENMVYCWNSRELHRISV